MNNRQRLTDLRDLLELLDEKLNDFRKDLVINAHQPARFELKQRIKREILPDIRRYEAEYWELYLSEAVISEEQAETQLDRVDQAVTSIERIPTIEYSPELLLLLQEIRAKLDEGDQAASAKLKVTIPLIPLIANYELEMDTEGVMNKTWKEIKRFFRR